VDAADGCTWDFEPLTASVTDAELVVARGPSSLQDRVIQLQIEFERATVYSLSGLERLPAPEILPLAHRFQQEAKVQLNGPGDAAELTLRYTCDAADPSVDSPVYAEPFAVNADTTVKAAYFLSAGRGPITTARYVRDTPLVPAEADDGVCHVCAFDRGAEGWSGIEQLSQHSQGGLSGGFLAVARSGGSGPILVCGAEVSGGAFAGDLQRRYGGDGVELRFAVRSSRKMRGLQLEIFGDAVGQWFYDQLAEPGRDWSQRAILARYDWTDAEAEAAGWRPGPTATSWRETMQAVEKLVIVSAPGEEAGELQLDEFSVRSAVETGRR
jgi:hypothetical protein